MRRDTRGAVGKERRLKRQSGVVSVGGRGMTQEADPLSFAPIK